MAEQPRGIVTPEAVVLEFETAGVGSRGLPALLDLLIQTIALFVLLLGLSALSLVEAGQTFAVIASLLLAFGILLGYPIVLETMWDGRTVGKAAAGLRVVTREGGPPRFRHAAIRSLTRLIEVIAFFGGPAVLSVMLTRDNQRVGDLIAGTIVVRERTADRTTTPVTFPPPYGYESYVASLDVSGLDAEQYGVIRSFLLRLAELTPDSRAVLAVRLANPVAHRLSHTPPPMVNPELFLASVASAYQLRHGGGVHLPAPPPAAEHHWAASQQSGGTWTGTAPAWPGAGPGSGPPPPAPPPPGPFSHQRPAAPALAPPGAVVAPGPPTLAPPDAAAPPGPAASPSSDAPSSPAYPSSDAPSSPAYPSSDPPPALPPSPAPPPEAPSSSGQVRADPSPPVSEPPRSD